MAIDITADGGGVTDYVLRTVVESAQRVRGSTPARSHPGGVVGEVVGG